MTGFGPRASGLRLIRIVVVCVAVGTVINSTGGVLLFISNQARGEDIRSLSLQARHDASVTTAALCALRVDLERRVATSRAFLVEHPNGIPGIPARTIRDGIVNQGRTITALAGIAC